MYSRHRAGGHGRPPFGCAGTRLARHHEHVRNTCQHFCHQVSNHLVKTHDRIVLEDLNVAGMLTNHRLARAITDAAWGELARQITYKQAWRGGHLLIADRWFPSSKTCSACGTVRASLGLDERVYHCASCGHTADRDRNAAINLATWPVGVRRTDQRRYGDTVLWFAERSDQGSEPA